MELYKESIVHVFTSVGKYYLYDVNTNKIVAINEERYKYFRNEKNEISSSSLAILHELSRKGLLKKNNIKEIKHGLTDYIDSFLEKKVQGITLQVTQQCNLRCKYCVYSGIYSTRTHNSRTMSLGVAKKAIDFLASHSSDIQEPSIGFYGGEPLLNFELIRAIINYCEHTFKNQNPAFVMTTNGTLFTEEILKFLDDKKVLIMISFDGPKEIHDKNRVFAHSGKGTFDTIIKNIKLIQEKFPNLYDKISYNAVVDPQNDQGCFNDFLIQFKDIDTDKISPSLVVDTMRKKNDLEWPERYFISSRHEDLLVFMSKLGRFRSKIASALKTSFAQFRATMFTMRNISQEIPESYHPGGPCLPGVRKLFVDVSGTFFPCERVSETSEHMKIGNIEEGFYKEKILRLLNIGKLTENECKKCWGIRFCGQCCATADDYTNLSSVTRLQGCRRSLLMAEEMLKNYCFLREHGYSFQNDDTKFIR